MRRRSRRAIQGDPLDGRTRPTAPCRRGGQDHVPPCRALQTQVASVIGKPTTARRARHRHGNAKYALDLPSLARRPSSPRAHDRRFVLSSTIAARAMRAYSYRALPSGVASRPQLRPGQAARDALRITWIRSNAGSPTCRSGEAPRRRARRRAAARQPVGITRVRLRVAPHATRSAHVCRRRRRVVRESGRREEPDRKSGSRGAVGLPATSDAARRPLGWFLRARLFFEPAIEAALISKP